MQADFITLKCLFYPRRIRWTEHVSTEEVFKENQNKNGTYTYNQNETFKIYVTYNEEWTRQFSTDRTYWR